MNMHAESGYVVAAGCPIASTLEIRYDVREVNMELEDTPLFLRYVFLARVRIYMRARNGSRVVEDTFDTY